MLSSFTTDIIVHVKAIVSEAVEVVIIASDLLAVNYSGGSVEEEISEEVEVAEAIDWEATEGESRNI